MPVMVGAKRRQGVVRSTVVNLEIYFIEAVDSDVYRRRQYFWWCYASHQRSLRGQGTVLSLQGTIRNTGDPVITAVGHSGDRKRGKTKATCLEGNRESDHLILVMSRRSLEGITKGHNDVW